MKHDITIMEGAEWMPQGENPGVESTAPGVVTAIMQPMRPSTLLFDAEFAPGKAVAFMTEQRHDGTQMMTCCGVSAVVEQAERYAAEKGGDWAISPVRLRISYGPDPERPRYQDEVIAVAIREKAA